VCKSNDIVVSHLLQEGKVLLIGGGIANFTDVAETFKGIVRALRNAQQQLRDGNIKIFVRRGGPNYAEGYLKFIYIYVIFCVSV